MGRYKRRKRAMSSILNITIQQVVRLMFTKAGNSSLHTFRETYDTNLRWKERKMEKHMKISSVSLDLNSSIQLLIVKGLV